MQTFAHEVHVDATGRRILRELQEDGRIALAELARRVSLSPPAVADRLRRLEAAGVISGYTARVSPRALGYGLLGFVRLALPADVRRELLISSLAGERRILECHHITGDDCFLLKVCARDPADLEDLLGKLAPLGTISTSIVLSSPLGDRPVLPPDDRGGSRTEPHPRSTFQVR